MSIASILTACWGSLSDFRKKILQTAQADTGSSPTLPVTAASDTVLPTATRSTSQVDLTEIRARLEAEADALWDQLADGPLPDTAHHVIGLLKSSYFWFAFALVVVGKTCNNFCLIL